jgi:hypothetical protein
MRNAVVEKVVDEIYVTLHATPEAADSYGVKIAMENTSSTEVEIREHFKQIGRHTEGDWGVYVVDAREL